MGSNPNDSEHDNCGNAAVLLIVYIIVNFSYNILMLAITKRGSAVLLGVSQVLRKLSIYNYCNYTYSNKIFACVACI